MTALEHLPTHCGFVAVIGAPNAGKSTLVNRMVDAKISIVTHKVQTTRTRIRAITIVDKTQIIFVDTPGIFAPRRRLDRAMVNAAWGGAADADAIVLLVDTPLFAEALKPKPSPRARVSRDDTLKIKDGLAKSHRRAILAFNKIDALPREVLLGVVERFKEDEQFLEVFLISAQTGDGVEDLKKYLAGTMPAGPWLYAEDQVADLPLRMLAAEITREKLMIRVHQELPYITTVETESWTEKKDGSVRIEQVIYVERGSQKSILLGKGGRTIKDIGKQARHDMEKSFERRVHLFLFVKVRGKWLDDPQRYSEMGLEFPLG